MDSVQMIGRRIYDLRTGANETQEMTAEAVNISHVALARYENGQRMPKLDILSALAAHFGVSVDYLIGHEMPGTDDDDDAWMEREQLRNDPDRRALMQLARRGSAQAVRQAAALLDVLKATNPDFYDGDDTP